jgi:hypothetical protein
MPGTGMKDPTRNTTKAPRTKRNRCLSSDEVPATGDVL